MEDIDRSTKQNTEFVIMMQYHYEEAEMTSNVHTLLHMHKSVLLNGPLWPISYYEFDNNMGNLLLGRNWIQALGVRLPEYKKAVHLVKHVSSLLTEFKSLFQPGAGIFTSTAASIHVPEGAWPCFFQLP